MGFEVVRGSDALAEVADEYVAADSTELDESFNSGATLALGGL